MKIPEGLNVDPNIVNYIKSIDDLNINYSRTPLDTEVQKVSEATIAEIKQQFHAQTQMSKTVKKNDGVETSQLIQWSEASVTEEESALFKKSLVMRDPDFLELVPGPLAELILFGENSTSDRRPLGTLELFEAINDELLPNGEKLLAGEKCGLWLYSFETYLLLNGTLNSTPLKLNKWLKQQKGVDPNTEEAQALLKKCQNEVPQVMKMFLSGLHKLPPHEGQLYRGKTLPIEELEDWKKGKYMITDKIFSCSAEASMAEIWAKTSAVEYMHDTHMVHKPVLYVIDAKNAKSIKDYAVYPDEEEYIYPPGQIFHSIEVDETTVPGLAIIYLEEVD